MTALDFPASPTDGQTFGNYIYNATRGVWAVQANVPGISSRYQVSATAPTTPQNGDMWFNSTDAVPYMYYVDGDSGQWIEVGGLSGSADSYFISDTPPTSQAVNGSMWFDTTTGNTFVYYTDTDSSQWVQISGQTLGGSIEDLSEVILTNASSGDALVFDGTNWVNSSVDVYDAATSSTGFFALPVGGDSDRPVTPANGHIRFNTDSGEPEYYSESEGAWFLFRQAALSTFEVEYLVIAGGGGGGYNGSAGGGAGGYRSSISGESSGGGLPAESPLSLDFATNYTVTVGGGGNGSTSNTDESNNGFASAFATISSIGGGGGGTGGLPSGLEGGSGGGRRFAGSVGPGTPGQGFAGGSGAGTDSGGGGGAGEAGDTDGVRHGGDGVSSLVTGSSVTRGGGGSGASDNNTSNIAGGLGGGGTGGNSRTNGEVNTGGGGGGGSGGLTGANGGSGIVIIKYPASVNITVDPGLVSSTSTIGEYAITQFTAGTGSVTFS